MEQLTDNERRVQKRKDRIKNILIVFLVVMLLLTFFSGTIQNWSLPEVATAYVQSASVSPQIRASGTAEADDPYNVMITQSRKIASVAVKVGDTVHKDDVLYYLEESESEELRTAERELRKLETDFELALFTGEVSDATIQRATNGQVSSLSAYQARLADVNQRLTAAQEADKSVTERLNLLTLDYNTRMAALGTADTSAQAYSNAEIDAELAALSAESTLKQGQLTTAQEEIKDTTKYIPLSPEYNAKAAEIAALEARLAEISARTTQLNTMRAANERDASQLTTQNAQAKAQLEQEYNQAKLLLEAEKAQTAAALEQVTAEKAELVAGISSEISLHSQLVEIEDARARVEQLREESVGATITAPVDGTISSLGYVAGQTTEADKPAAVIQVAGKAMTMSISVTAEQARTLKVGDMADPQNAWAYNTFKAQITSIRPDPQDPAGKRLVTFAIDTPEVQPGQTVNIKIGESQRNYEMTVPNSAIREDNNGKFILIIDERTSPLRNRYIARRVDVDVVAQDDTTSAITAALEGYEYVITTASAPIRSGQEVRLASTGY